MAGLSYPLGWLRLGPLVGNRDTLGTAWLLSARIWGPVPILSSFLTLGVRSRGPAAVLGPWALFLVFIRYEDQVSWAVRTLRSS